MTKRQRYRRKHGRVSPRGWVSLAAGVGLLLATFFSAISLRVADRFDADAGYATAVITGRSILRSAEDDAAYRVRLTYKTEGLWALWWFG